MTSKTKSAAESEPAAQATPEVEALYQGADGVIVQAPPGARYGAMQGGKRYRVAPKEADRLINAKRFVRIGE